MTLDSQKHHQGAVAPVHPRGYRAGPRHGPGFQRQQQEAGLRHGQEQGDEMTGNRAGRGRGNGEAYILFRSTSYFDRLVGATSHETLGTALNLRLCPQMYSKQQQ